MGAWAPAAGPGFRPASLFASFWATGFLSWVSSLTFSAYIHLVDSGGVLQEQICRGKDQCRKKSVMCVSAPKQKTASHCWSCFHSPDFPYERFYYYLFPVSGDNALNQLPISLHSLISKCIRGNLRTCSKAGKTSTLVFSTQFFIYICINVSVRLKALLD